MLSEAWVGAGHLPLPCHTDSRQGSPRKTLPRVFFFKPLYSGRLVVTNWIMYTGLPTYPWEKPSASPTSLTPLLRGG